VTATREPLEDYFRALSDVDPVRATSVVLDLLDEGTPVRDIATQVLAPAQVRVGRMWEQGRWSVADEHAATAVTETALHALSAAHSGAVKREGPHVLVACAEGEWHSLPARLAATIASAGGARVTVLGPSLPADHVLRRLAKGDIDVLALSCTMPTNLIGAARCISVAHEVGVPVIAGGGAFGHSADRSDRLGADRWGADGTALLDPVPRLAGRSTEIPPEALMLDAVSEQTMDLAYSQWWQLCRGSQPWIRYSGPRGGTTCAGCPGSPRQRSSLGMPRSSTTSCCGRWVCKTVGFRRLSRSLRRTW
jgi:methanogenic corrinoid protein MtbC1